ncbi:MAG: DUF2207 domain-containing protein [Acidobacteriaceae bacterium]
MKKFFIILFALAFFWPATSKAQEAINNYTVAVTMNKDSSIDVSEKIAYDFGSDVHHGIFRNIPYKYQRNGANYNLRISGIQIADEAGNPIKYSTTNDGSTLSIKIGDPNQAVSGQKTYVLNYHVLRAINYFSDHDELYWNAVGTDWSVPMGPVEAAVTLPDGVDMNKVTSDCYSGYLGEKTPCQKTVQQNSIMYGRSALLPEQGMSVVVGLPKGILTQQSSIKYFFLDNGILALPLLGLIVMVLIWFYSGRDPKPTIPMVAQYEAPDNLTPAEVGYLMDEQSQSGEITAEIIYLCTKGYLKIERIPKQGWFGKDDFKLIRLKKEDEALTVFDRDLMKTLFVLGPDEVLLSSLQKKAKLTRSSLSLKEIPKKLTSEGYYGKNPNRVRLGYILVPIACLILLGFAFRAIATFVSWTWPVAIGLTFIVVLIVGYFMPKKTQKGADTKQLILGLKEYLSVAEKDRLDFHNDPAKDPKVFEKLLPYAIALGVSEQWAKKFEGLFTAQPSWYSDPSASVFNPLLFNMSMMSFGRGFNTMVIQNNPRANVAGGGGSGFGGGGFSGGGFGGGGGGSW